MVFSAERLVSHPGFIVALGQLARELRVVHDETPRLARAMTSHRRWLLSQAAFTLYLEYDPADLTSGLTTVRLKDMIEEVGGASRNTVLNYLDEMVTYRFARYVDVPGRRYRRLDVADITCAAMMRWFIGNLAALDYLDNGQRAGTMIGNPHLLRIAQPLAARACLHNPAWRDPPGRIAVFLWTESGGLVLDELIARIDLACEEDGRIDIGRINARKMAETFKLSRTHLQRVLKKAADMGCIGWQDTRRSATMWFSRDFLNEYAAWQAIKFAAVDQAFDAAVQTISGLQNEADEPIGQLYASDGSS